ncbi:hypothetical protein BDR26DRAFT_940576 [Obelidium mucronatum]|nr:hypothetical protein BDR26DRAFT_940576 [Obelidium mucronatum]
MSSTHSIPPPPTAELPPPPIPFASLLSSTQTQKFMRIRSTANQIEVKEIEGLVVLIWTPSESALYLFDCLRPSPTATPVRMLQLDGRTSAVTPQQTDGTSCLEISNSKKHTWVLSHDSPAVVTELEDAVARVVQRHLRISRTPLSALKCINTPKLPHMSVFSTSYLSPPPLSNLQLLTPRTPTPIRVKTSPKSPTSARTMGECRPPLPFKSPLSADVVKHRVHWIQ